jgi:uncharacterized protein
LKHVGGPFPKEVLRKTLGAGEREAIALSAQLRAELLIVDDDLARRIATDLGIPVMGTAGVLLRAKEKGFVVAVRPHLDALLSNRFFLDRKVYDLVLSKAGEPGVYPKT